MDRLGSKSQTNRYTCVANLCHSEKNSFLLFCNFSKTRLEQIERTTSIVSFSKATANKTVQAHLKIFKVYLSDMKIFQGIMGFPNSTEGRWGLIWEASHVGQDKIIVLMEIDPLTIFELWIVCVLVPGLPEQQSTECSPEASSEGREGMRSGGRGDYYVPWHIPFHRADAVSALRASNSSPQGSNVASKGSISRETGSVVYKRYYHLFDEGELQALVEHVPELEVESTFYDKSNWCCIFRKQPWMPLMLDCISRLDIVRGRHVVCGSMTPSKLSTCTVQWQNPFDACVFIIGN